MSDNISHDPKGYWRAKLRLTLLLLTIWFLVSFGAGILLREALDAYSIEAHRWAFGLLKMGPFMSLWF